MTTTFIRLLAAADKAAALASATAALRVGSPNPDTYPVDATSFRKVPGTPFAYWVRESVRRLFSEMSPVESNGREVRVGGQTGDDFRFVRAWWEVMPSTMVSGTSAWTPEGFRRQTFSRRKWASFAKGGAYSPYHSDLSLLVNWGNDAQEIKDWVMANARDPNTTHWSRRVQNIEYYFRCGLTYSDRTSTRFAPRTMSSGTVISVKGSAVYADKVSDLWWILAITNSAPFAALMDLILGTTSIAKSYQVGTIGRVPVPDLGEGERRRLASNAREAHDLKRDADRDDEVTHPFTVPALVRLRPHATLADAGAALAAEDAAQAQRLAAIQREIDDRCFALYGFSDEDRAQAERGDQTLAAATAAESDDAEAPEADDGEDASTDSGRIGNAHRLPRATADLLMYALGCAFGRWDARIGRDPSLAPPLADPFAPLPVCAPGALVGLDGLPATKARIASEEWLRARPDVITLPSDGDVHSPVITAEDYALPVAWDGMLVDDADAQEDVVRRVRAVLDHLWGERASAIEQEACDILGVRELREYFRNPRAFFDFHIGRYSKSRRKAPIYWLLQSPRRHYAIWLSYHRLDADLLFKALTMHLLPKIAREERRLEELVAAKQQAGASGSEARRAALAVERQEALLADLREFRAALDRAAKLYLTPDLNDGVLLNIAPLWEVVPWKEAKTAWQQLTAGKYEWSSIGRQLREKGLVKLVKAT